METRHSSRPCDASLKTRSGVHRRGDEVACRSAVAVSHTTGTGTAGGRKMHLSPGQQTTGGAFAHAKSWIAGVPLLCALFSCESSSCPPSSSLPLRCVRYGQGAREDKGGGRAACRTGLRGSAVHSKGRRRLRSSSPPARLRSSVATEFSRRVWLRREASGAAKVSGRRGWAPEQATAQTQRRMQAASWPCNASSPPACARLHRGRNSAAPIQTLRRASWHPSTTLQRELAAGCTAPSVAGREAPQRGEGATRRA
ncbi:hypothetical protein SVAN01_04725 [Stagonosporopsis vannaccii]|nr:hypothetical protein SVAN01_04725 [Stagonosporopsis vannaccii]